MSQIQIVMVTNSCRPVIDPSQTQNGKPLQRSLVFKAGQLYTVERTPIIELWLQKGYAYLFGQEAPKTPPQYDPPIQAKGAALDDSETLLSKLADMIADRIGGKRRPVPQS